MFGNHDKEFRDAAPIPGTSRGSPNLQLCRAKLAGFGDYVDCLSARPECCVFALSFGNGFLCRHADRHQIVARTNGTRGESGVKK